MTPRIMSSRPSRRKASTPAPAWIAASIYAMPWARAMPPIRRMTPRRRPSWCRSHNATRIRSWTITAVTKYRYRRCQQPRLMTAMVPPRGNAGPNPGFSYATTYVYFSSGSAAGLLQQVTTPLGGKTTYEYDAAGRIIKMVGPNGNAVGAVPAPTPGSTSTIRKTAHSSPKRRHRLPGDSFGVGNSL